MRRQATLILGAYAGVLAALAVIGASLGRFG